MSYIQLVAPDTGATDNTGMCLRFTQRVFQNLNPFFYRSAWEAWQNTVHKSYERNLPDVAVPVWFSHYGTYGQPPSFENWGHTLGWIPGRGFLSSPAWGTGSQWFSTIEEIENTFNCKFVGWSLDIGGLTVAWPATSTGGKPQKQKRVFKMGKYIPKTLLRQKIAPAKGKDVRKTIRRSLTAATIMGGGRKGQVTASVWLRGPAGGRVEIAIYADTIRGGATVKRRQIRTVTETIPTGGLLKAQVTGIAVTDANGRVRVTVRNDTAKTVTVTQLGWDILQ